MAIMTRWRHPPESWKGIFVDRPLGFGNAHQAQHLDCLVARGAARQVRAMSVSAIWRRP